jgi:hypothetical protein
MKTLYTIFFFVLLSSILIQCSNGKKEDAGDSKDSVVHVDTNIFGKNPLFDDSCTLLEEIIDSSIGKNGEFKLEIQSIQHQSRGQFISYRLRKKRGDFWELLQEFVTRKQNADSIDLLILDYNNDGYKDFSIYTAIEPNSANERRNVFIFDKTYDTLVPIKNSSNYPNLRYNKALDCLDSWEIYTGSSTIFLELEQDSLREFAGVSLFDDVREVYTININGKLKVLKKETIKDLDVYQRYINFRPLRAEQEVL